MPEPIKFPVSAFQLNESSDDGRCIVCQSTVVGRPFLLWTVGAIYSTDSGVNGGPHDNKFAFMRLAHGDRGELESATIFEDVTEGQADIYFCSKRCFRKFLNSLLNRFDL